MKIKIFNTMKEAMTFVYPDMKRGRLVGVKKLKSGKWEARIMARKR